jgi:hypothetical protein
LVTVRFEQYVGTIDILSKNAATHTVKREDGALSLPVGRELVGCAAVGGLVLFAGGKPPHPPAPMGEVRCSGLAPICTLTIRRISAQGVTIVVGCPFIDEGDRRLAREYWCVV